jgi:hypothetical protein
MIDTTCSCRPADPARPPPLPPTHATRSWPQPAWRHSDGKWQPAYANFTSLATPNELGSGK